MLPTAASPNLKYDVSAQVAAENRALEAAKQGAAKKLKDAEARVDVLEGTVAELRDELERQVGAGETRRILRIRFCMFIAAFGSLWSAQRLEVGDASGARSRCQILNEQHLE
jgi:hypothetical protein